MLSKFLRLYDSIENALIKCKQEKFITVEESKVLEDFDKRIIKTTLPGIRSVGHFNRTTF